MTNLAILPLNYTSELDTLDQKLVKGGWSLFGGNEVTMTKETTVQNILNQFEGSNAPVNQVNANSGGMVSINN